MYDGNGVVIDRREMLRVKLKVLTAEAKIIRKEERRSRGLLRDELHNHRVLELRRAARATHMAYGLIRGRSIERIEVAPRTPPNWSEVGRLLKKYGPLQPIQIPQ